MHFTAFIALFLVLVSAVPAPGQAPQGASLVRRQPKGGSKSKGSKSSKGDDSGNCPAGMIKRPWITSGPVYGNEEQVGLNTRHSICYVEDDAPPDALK
jgi:hypothetical protein